MAHLRTITIERQYASGGREIGKRLSERLGIPFYDGQLLMLAAEKYGLNPGVVKANDDSYQIKSLTVDGASVDVAAEIAAGNVIKTNDNYYIYKTLPIQRAYTAEVVFEQKHKVTFQGIKKNITGGVQTIVDEVIEVFHGDKIPSDQLDKMVDKAVEATGNVTKNAFFA